MSKSKTTSVDIIERPKICCIDLDKDVTKALTDTGANLYIGSLGHKIRVPNSTRGSYQYMLLDIDLPANLHEYDIIIVDLNNFETIDYIAKTHKRPLHTGKTETSLLCSYPETLFDPRPYGSYYLNGLLHDIKEREFLVIAFSAEDYSVDYEPVISTSGYPEKQAMETHHIYSFLDKIPLLNTMYGEEISIESIRDDIEVLLKKHAKEAAYHQTFFHPYTWTGGQKINNENFMPLMKNMNGDIVSYIEISTNENLIILPQIKDKGGFLIDFLTNIAPSFLPKLFPYSTKFSWKMDEEYWLPEHLTLIKEQQSVKEEFERQLIVCELKIQANIDKYSYLHELLSESGPILVNALIKYFKWLGFEDVIDHDEVSSDVLEEDIQIKLPNGLLIIECKGIGGTSTDSDCSQVSKIKHRRCKERKAFDVSALYVVNHQRFLPPLKRKDVPFTKEQIQDAINDERGLLTTWQLFNLYFDIEKGTISKDEARELILEYGHVDFKPKDLVVVDEPKEILCEGFVCIVNVKDVVLKINDVLFLEKNGRFEKVRILDIQSHDKSVESASNGEFGLKFDKKIVKKTRIFKKRLPLTPAKPQ